MFLEFLIFEIKREKCSILGKSGMDRRACWQTNKARHGGRGQIYCQVERQGKEGQVVHEESGEQSEILRWRAMEEL